MKKTLCALLAALFLLAGCTQQSSSREVEADALAQERAQAAAQTGLDEDTLQNGTNAPVPAREEVEAVTPLDLGDDVILIRDRLFIAQVDEIFLNYEDYLGKTIRYEGIYQHYFYDNSDGETQHIDYVVRWGPGCCGDDGIIGFEIDLAGYERPESGEWVLLEGELVFGEVNGWEMVHIRADTLEVLEERGEEWVWS